MKLQEREHEYEVLLDALDGCVRGAGQVIVLSGAVATGKTALLHSFTQYASDAGARVLSAVASREERTSALGVLNQLLRGMPDPGSASFRGERFPVGEAADVGIAPDAQARCDDLLGIAERTPVVLTVDDLQYCDVESLGCLLYLIRRLRDVPLVLILTECSRPQQANPRFHAELARHPYFRRLSLRLLSPGGVAALIADCVDRSVEPCVALTYHAMSGGNALFVRSLIDDRLGADPTAAPVAGEAYRQAVMNCLIRCEMPVLAVAKACAVLGAGWSSALVGRLAGSNAPATEQALKTLAATGMLVDGRFRHESMRRAVLDGTTPEERSRLHCKAAVLLHEEGADARTVARHLIAVDLAELRRTVAPWGLLVFRNAAEAALDDDVELAVSCLRKASEVCVWEDERLAIIAALSGAEWWVDPAHVVRHLPLLQSALAEGRLTGRAAVAAICFLLWFGHAGEAAEALARLRRAAGTANAEVAAELDVLSLGLFCCYPELFAPSTADYESVSLRAKSSVKARPTVQAVALLSKVLTGSVGGEDTLAEAEQILQGLRRGKAAVVPATATLAAMLYADRPDRAASWAEQLLTEGEEVGARAPMARAVHTAVQAMISVRVGDLPGAERLASTALTQVPPAGWGVLVGVPLSVLLTATAAMGRLSDAARVFDVSVPETMFRTPSGLHYLEARGLYHLAENRLHAALDDFQLCGSLMSDWGLDLPAVVPWRSHAAQVASRLGRKEDAGRLVGEQMAMLGPTSSRAAGISLRVLADVSEPHRRPVLLRRAVQVLEECGDRLELARALAALNEALRESGERNEASGLRRRAVRLARACAAEPLLRKLTRTATPTLGAADGDAPAAGLSESQWRVAALAADGHTNRQIARRLFITVSTVEQHLTKVYRKLHINGRSELSKWVQDLRC